MNEHFPRRNGKALNEFRWIIYGLPFFYLHEAAFLADNSARELGNLCSIKKPSYQRTATLCPQYQGINVHGEIKNTVSKEISFACISFGIPFLFRRKALTITMWWRANVELG